MQVFNAQRIREDFPALSFCNAKGQRIVYLDNSATTQKPRCVIEALVDFYQHMNANVHRSFYEWGNRATEAYEHTRVSLSKFIGAQHPEEVIFTRGATESINCLADIIGQRYFQQGDEVLVSELEHHSNLIPWQMQQKKRGIQVKGWPVDADGNLEISALQTLLTPRTKLLAVTQVSNVLGTTPNLKEIIACAHANGTLVLVDGAQALAHLKINVQDMDCDFYAGSSHKMYGPMGVGFFYGKRKWLEALPPYHGGGTMMESVFMDSFTEAGVPKRFEAGTPPVADVIGLGKAIAYLQQFDWQSLMRYEEAVIAYAERTLCAIPGVRLIGHPETKTAIVSFLVDKIHPHDVATIVNNQNIALRAGHHCCQPLMHRLGCRGGVVRVSLGMYNTFEDIDRLAEAIDVALTVFKS
ncbi:MAG: cysteine desulfurase [Puniceicoccales bacterium]|jgi:cysteine desulfurase/selenocysteine lyase|nr:cysteine desulfurase [Puniceicoccales bacterium]